MSAPTNKFESFEENLGSALNAAGLPRSGHPGRTITTTPSTTNQCAFPATDHGIEGQHTTDEKTTNGRQKMESGAMYAEHGLRPLNTSGSRPTPSDTPASESKTKKLFGAISRNGGDASPTQRPHSVYL